VGRLLRLLVCLGALGAADVVDGNLVVESRTAERHRHFRVESDGTALFVKVARRPDGFSATEIAVHTLARDGALNLRGVVPGCLGAERSTGTVVLPLLPVDTLGAHVAAGDGTVPPRLAAGLGRALRQVHRAGLGNVREPVLPVVRPWALALARGEQGLPASVPVTPWARAVVAVAGRPEVRGRLDGLRDTWESRALIHGDVRSSNVLVPTPSPERRVDPPDHGVWLVDWECGGLGDPGWDVGGALQDWVRVALTAAARGSPPGGCGPRAAAMALRRLRPAYDAFWDGYGHDAASLPAGRIAAMAGARLLQTCLEEDSPAPVHALLLQFAAHVLAAPDAAAREVFGR
jgi:hypothetical protein